MRYMGRAARMSRHHSRQKKGAGLNLVSLMDIFTILVFFLLVNSGDVQTLPNPKNIELPQSVAKEKAREAVVVTVTDDDLLVEGHAVARVADVLADGATVIPALKAALEDQTARALRSESKDDIAKREVTIMGDKKIPYRLLKKVMATCTAASYGRLSLAVLQKAPDAALTADARQ
jgi:biopolymer transport protein ExbD